MVADRDELVRPRRAWVAGSRRPVLRVAITVCSVLLMSAVAYVTVRQDGDAPAGAALGEKSASSSVPGMQPWMAKLLNSAKADAHREYSIEHKQVPTKPTCCGAAVARDVSSAGSPRSCRCPPARGQAYAGFQPRPSEQKRSYTPYYPLARHIWCLCRCSGGCSRSNGCKRAATPARYP
jgi:hypothetical protein